MRPLILPTDDNINDELLIMIANNLGEEWKTFLKNLGITKTSIHLIMKLNKHYETNINNFDDKYDALRKWVLNELKFVPKVRSYFPILTL